MLGADVVRREEPQERRALARSFDGGAAVGFFALDDADDGGDVMPASCAASMALMVEAPVVQTSSTMTTRAPSRQKPSMRRPVPWAFSALRTRKPWSSGAPGC